MNRRHAPLWLALTLCLGLSACGIGQRQNPVASDGELGSTVQVDEDKPATYTTRSGDTLAGIAGRPEIYGDPALWPLIQGANLDSLSGKGSSEGLESGLLLQVPRGTSPQALAQAREQARQAQAAAKARRRPKHRESAPPVAVKRAPLRKAEAAKPVPMKKAAVAAPKPAATAVAAAPSPAAQSVPKPRASGLRPLLLLLLLVLLALGAVLWAFARKDRDDGA